MDTAIELHPRDEGAIEPSTSQIVVAAITSYFWAGILPSAIIPIGFIITFFRLHSITGAGTWRGRFRFGKKALIASAVAAVLGFLLRAGVFMVLVDGSMNFVLRLA